MSLYRITLTCAGRSASRVIAATTAGTAASIAWNDLYALVCDGSNLPVVTCEIIR